VVGEAVAGVGARRRRGEEDAGGATRGLEVTALEQVGARQHEVTRGRKDAAAGGVVVAILVVIIVGVGGRGLVE
jgi:hypothetical protein